VTCPTTPPPGLIAVPVPKAVLLLTEAEYLRGVKRGKWGKRTQEASKREAAAMGRSTISFGCPNAASAIRSHRTPIPYASSALMDGGAYPVLAHITRNTTANSAQERRSAQNKPFATAGFIAGTPPSARSGAAGHEAGRGPASIASGASETNKHMQRPTEGPPSCRAGRYGRQQREACAEEARRSRGALTPLGNLAARWRMQRQFHLAPRAARQGLSPVESEGWTGCSR